MNKKLLTAGVAASLAAPAAMAGDVTIYGIAHASLSYYDYEQTGHTWDVSGNASRLGFKGSEDLGGGLSAIWQMELAIPLADTDFAPASAANIVNGDGGAIRMRNSFVGLAGGWGTFLVGRHDTPYKISTASLDLFSDTIADYNSNAADGVPLSAGPLFNGFRGLGFEDLRFDNTIAYISPNWNGLTLAGAFVTVGGPDITGHDLGELVEAYSLAALYSNGPFFASVAYEDADEDDAAVATYGAAVLGTPLLADSKWRAGVGYTANGFHVGLVYEKADYPTYLPVVGLEMERWQLSGSYTFGNNVIKGMYGTQDIDTTPTSATLHQWAIGVDHNFSKRTTAYLLYTDFDSDGHNYDWDAFSLGLKHSF